MRIRKYKKLNVNTYVPEKKLKINKEETIPMAIDVGNNFSNLGGFLGFFFSSFLISFKSFRKTKRKLRDFKSKYEKTVDLT